MGPKSQEQTMKSPSFGKDLRFFRWKIGFFLLGLDDTFSLLVESGLRTPQVMDPRYVSVISKCAPRSCGFDRGANPKPYRWFPYHGAPLNSVPEQLDLAPSGDEILPVLRLLCSGHNVAPPRFPPGRPEMTRERISGNSTEIRSLARVDLEDFKR